MISSIKLFNNKVMGPVPKNSKIWDRSHVMRDWSHLDGTGTPRTHSNVESVVIFIMFEMNLQNLSVCLFYEYYLLYAKYALVYPIIYLLNNILYINYKLIINILQKDQFRFLYLVNSFLSFWFTHKWSLATIAGFNNQKIIHGFLIIFLLQ